MTAEHFPLQTPILRSVVSALLFLVLTCLPSAANEIDDFIKGFDGLSLNGIWPGVDLPPNAPIEKVVEVFAESQSKTTDAQQYAGYSIVEVRKAGPKLPMMEGGYIVLISSARGSKTILLMRNFGRGWSIRPYYITTAP